MSRVIKFRCWNIERKVMYPPWSIWKTNLTEFHETEDLVLMQFTGLLDRDGVEIYEGDYLSPEDADQRFAGVVVFNAGMTCINYIDCRDGAEVNSPLLFPDLYAVIGNIHEHPHLITAHDGAI